MSNPPPAPTAPRRVEDEQPYSVGADGTSVRSRFRGTCVEDVSPSEAQMIAHLLNRAHADALADAAERDQPRAGEDIFAGDLVFIGGDGRLYRSSCWTCGSTVRARRLRDTLGNTCDAPWHDAEPPTGGK